MPWWFATLDLLLWWLSQCTPYKLSTVHCSEFHTFQKNLDILQQDNKVELEKELPHHPCAQFWYESTENTYGQEYLCREYLCRVPGADFHTLCKGPMLSRSMMLNTEHRTHVHLRVHMLIVQWQHQAWWVQSAESKTDTVPPSSTHSAFWQIVSPGQWGLILNWKGKKHQHIHAWSSDQRI